MGVLLVIVTWESKANSSSTFTKLQTGTELGNRVCHSESPLCDNLIVKIVKELRFRGKEAEAQF